jgi:hypothetical protein
MSIVASEADRLLAAAANVADRLLSAIVPRAAADALTCTGCIGVYCCRRVTCYCAKNPSGVKVWYDACYLYGNHFCTNCVPTVWTC